MRTKLFFILMTALVIYVVVFGKESEDMSSLRLRYESEMSAQDTTFFEQTNLLRFQYDWSDYIEDSVFTENIFVEIWNVEDIIFDEHSLSWYVDYDISDIIPINGPSYLRAELPTPMAEFFSKCYREGDMNGEDEPYFMIEVKADRTLGYWYTYSRVVAY